MESCPHEGKAEYQQATLNNMLEKINDLRLDMKVVMATIPKISELEKALERNEEALERAFTTIAKIDERVDKHEQIVTTAERMEIFKKIDNHEKLINQVRGIYWLIGATGMSVFGFLTYLMKGL